jgi:hypothetical protein
VLHITLYGSDRSDCGQLHALQEMAAVTAGTTTDEKAAVPRRNCCYEQLGAPGLVYRNLETYSVQDDDPRLCNATLYASAQPSDAETTASSGLRAAQSKKAALTANKVLSSSQAAMLFCHGQSYYPMDFHVVRHSVPPLPPMIQRLCLEWTTRRSNNTKTGGGAKKCSDSIQPSLEKDASVEHGADGSRSGDENGHANGGAKATIPETDEVRYATLEELAQEYDNQSDDDDDGIENNPIVCDRDDPITPFLPSLKERNKAVKRAFRVQGYQTDQIFGLQLRARAHMLLTTGGGSNDNDDPKVHYQAKQVLQATTQLDANYVPGKETVRTSEQKKVVTRLVRRAWGLSRSVRSQTQLYDRQRQNRADPAYLAPFDWPSLEEATVSDVQTRLGNGSNRMPPAISGDDPNAPCQFGNCIALLLCQCHVCATSSNRNDCETDQGGDGQRRFEPVPCLLHPVGPLQDRIRLSFQKSCS